MRAQTVEEKIDKWAYKDPMSGCWIWLGFLNKDGYGMGGNHQFPGISLAHKLSYLYFKGEIKPGFELDHKCRVRCCVNPEHLEPVIHAENIRRGIYPKETHVHGKKTHCKRGHIFDEANTQRVVWNGGIGRVCAACRAIRRKIYKDRKQS